MVFVLMTRYICESFKKNFANYLKEIIMIGSLEYPLHPCFTILIGKMEGLTERRKYATL